MIKSSIFLIALTLITSFMYSCKSDDPEDLSKNCLVVNFYDPLNDVDTSFVDLRNSIVEFIKDTIVVRIGLANIPPKITFNQVEIPINSLNIKYEVIFDVDSSGTRTIGDLSLIISRFKFEEGELDADLISATQKDIWKQVSSTSQSVIANLFDVSISGNTLIIRAPLTLSGSLSTIDCKTNVVFLTYYNTGLKSYFDQSPG